MLHICRLLPDDVAAYRAIRLEALQKEPLSFGSTYDEEVKKDKLAFESYIEAQSPDHVAFGAFDNEELVGITVWMRDERQRLRHRGKIGQVYVRTEHRGKGYAKQLMKAVIDDAFSNPEIEILSLEAVAGNDAATGLYTSLGFREYGRFEKYFKTEDGYLDQTFMVLYRADCDTVFTKA